MNLSKLTVILLLAVCSLFAEQVETKQFDIENQSDTDFHVSIKTPADSSSSIRKYHTLASLVKSDDTWSGTIEMTNDDEGSLPDYYMVVITSGNSMRSYSNISFDTAGISCKISADYKLVCHVIR